MSTVIGAMRSGALFMLNWGGAIVVFFLLSTCDFHLNGVGSQNKGGKQIPIV